MCHVWVPRRRLYDISALHIVGGIIHISRLSYFLLSGACTLYPLTSRLDVLRTFPATICVRLVGIPCAPYRTRLFFPLRLEGGTILHVLTLVFQFLVPTLGVFLQKKLRLRQSLVLFYAAIGIYHWILFAMLYTLRKIFHQSTSVASYWQKTDIIHMNSKAWLWVNGPWFLFSSPQALQTSWELLFPFLIRVHYSSTIKTEWNERFYFSFITNSTCMHIFV